MNGSIMLRLDGSGPLYQQVYRTVRDEILNERLAPGEKVPSTRALASYLKVSRNTAVMAFEQLLAEGYIETRPGAAGSVVASFLQQNGATGSASNAQFREDAKPRLSDVGRRGLEAARRRRVQWQLRPARLPYDFRLGRPAFADVPHALWCRLLGRRARRACLDDLEYGPPEGREELRKALADRLGRSRGVETTPDQIVIVNGSQQALDLIARVLLNSGDSFLIEEPHYSGALSAFMTVGAKPVLARVDEEGMRIPTLVARHRSPRLVYVTPSHQFPTGVVMPLA
ncbi:MAG: PLP-dependent aminotransferase family protein, partial [Deltaproteobacteria bacterium]|nr:PLP-dependent aminotransferase family protein [Deltaproteobacteria bacterium]